MSEFIFQLSSIFQKRACWMEGFVEVYTLQLKCAKKATFFASQNWLHLALEPYAHWWGWRLERHLNMSLQGHWALSIETGMHSRFFFVFWGFFKMVYLMSFLYLLVLLLLCPSAFHLKALTFILKCLAFWYRLCWVPAEVLLPLLQQQVLILAPSSTQETHKPFS